VPHISTSAAITAVAAWDHWIQSATAIGTGTGHTAQTCIWTIWTGGVTGSATNGTMSLAAGATVTGGGGSVISQQWVEYVDSAATLTMRRAAYPTEVRAAPPARRAVSPEERAAYEARERELQARLEAEREFRRVAEAKAELLLQRLLNPEQRETLKEKKCFYMYSKGKKYRIDRGQHGNVKLLDTKDQVVESYCIQPKGGIPDADAMAAQKLLLEADPETFVRVANITRRDGSIRQGTPLAAVG
jgi:hypothetical protein